MTGLFNGLQSDLFGQRSFEGHLLSTRAGDVQLTRLAASGHRVVQRASPGQCHEPPRLKIVVPRAGRVAIAQHGRCT